MKSALLTNPSISLYCWDRPGVVGREWDLPATLLDAELEVHVIGDAFEPREALDTIHEGFRITRKL